MNIKPHRDYLGQLIGWLSISAALAACKSSNGGAGALTAVATIAVSDTRLAAPQMSFKKAIP
jgi:hypothetical protein